MTEDTLFFDNLGKDYDTKFLNLNHQGAQLVYETYANFITQYIPSKNSNILEIGCGSGIFLRYLHYVGYKNLYGLDPSIKILRYAHEKNNFVNYVKGNAQDLPFNEYFHCVVLQDALHHILDIDRCFSEIKNVLVPGGILIILDPNKKNFIGEIVRWVLKKIGFLTPTERTLRLETIKNFLDKNNFDITKVMYFGVISFPLSGIVFGKTILPNSSWLFDTLIAFDRKIMDSFISEYLGWKIIIIAKRINGKYA